MPHLQVKGLSYTYGSGVRALDGVDLEVRRGELIAVIGPNAAGKSTLARLLKGLLKADSGSIRIGGRRFEGRGADPRVGILFSNPENQIVTSIVEEDIAFGLEVSGQSPPVIAAKVDRILDRLGIEHLRRRMPHLLSGGEQQMVALAGTLVLEPEVVVLDEPTTYLDPEGQASVMRALRDLAAGGASVVLITHDMAEAFSADRAVLLDGGRVVMDEAPWRLFSLPGIEVNHGIAPPFLHRLAVGLKDLGGDLGEGTPPASVAALLAGMVRGMPPAPAPEPPRAEKASAGPDALAYVDVAHGYTGSGTGGEILSGVNFSVPQGSLSLLCGANGSGKSTLLQMANGIVRPDRGSVLFKGERLKAYFRNREPIHGRIGLLFQNAERQLFSETVRDDIAFGPRNLGLSRQEVSRRVREAALWVGLDEDVLSRPVHTLSGGQMRRAAVAGVLAMDPELLVLDEPTDGLDPAGTGEFFQRAHDYCRSKGTTILMAGHRIPDQAGLLDHVAYLRGGKVVLSGPPSRVLGGTSGALPEGFLPEHLKVQNYLRSLGILTGDPELDPARALDKMLRLVPGP